jgi:hypothetical protein
MVWFVLSIYPLAYGWYVVVSFRSIPIKLVSEAQNFKVNSLSLSEVIYLGTL